MSQIVTPTVNYGCYQLNHVIKPLAGFLTICFSCADLPATHEHMVEGRYLTIGKSSQFSHSAMMPTFDSILSNEPEPSI
jgi:hypothetical protein